MWCNTVFSNRYTPEWETCCFKSESEIKLLLTWLSAESCLNRSALLREDLWKPCWTFSLLACRFRYDAMQMVFFHPGILQWVVKKLVLFPSICNNNLLKLIWKEHIFKRFNRYLMRKYVCTFINKQTLSFELSFIEIKHAFFYVSLHNANIEVFHMATANMHGFKGIFSEYHSRNMYNAIMYSSIQCSLTRAYAFTFIHALDSGCKHVVLHVKIRLFFIYFQIIDKKWSF